MACLLSVYSAASAVSELLSPKRPSFPQDPARISAPPLGPYDKQAVAISPGRGTVEANYAMGLALQVLSSGTERTEDPELNKAAQKALDAALGLTPGDSRMWLALALLRSRIDQRDPGIREALRMSYFTAPNDATLMPVRLDTATLFAAVTDADLAELVRGDVRLILTQHPDLQPALSNAYRRGSAEGKAFLETAVRLIDPQFIPALRG